MSIMDKIFENRKEFLIIGLTGRTACGCTTAGKILKTPFKDLSLDSTFNSSDISNERRKDRIAYNYAKTNWKPFYYIKFSDIITSFLLQHKWDEVFIYLKNIYNSDYEKSINHIEKIKEIYSKWYEEFKTFDYLVQKPQRYENAKLVLDKMDTLKKCSNLIKKTLNTAEPELYTKVFQRIGDNVRKYGCAIPDNFSKNDASNLYALVERVNDVIKTIKESSEKRFVIDAIRNPLEAVFFKERYSAFYLFSVNCIKEDRHNRLIHLLKHSQEKIEEIDKKESCDLPEGTHELDVIVSQNIPECIQKADVHVSNPGDSINHSYVELTTQLVRYIVLIEHPGIISPTADERIMQLAFTAKENSCCISRKVGAVVVSENKKIAGIGWNDVPQGQVGCSLRNTDDLIQCLDEEAYSDFELRDLKFRKVANEIFKVDSFTKYSGLPKPFCFKAMKYKLDGEKNQIHTRALHAEENAFLQNVKKGGIAVEGGTLFSTASPCELCAKKAYQLGIRRIVYIDPYPGISEMHIFKSGEESSRPSVELFTGAIGQSYFKLYSPILSYKDELISRQLKYKE